MADIQSKIDNPKSAIPKLDPKTDGSTVNIVEQNVAKLKELFPDIVTEGRIDFDALRETLGNHTDDRQERYSFTWNGKSLAKRIAQTPSTGTLRPCSEESVNWETTQNLFIEGDNLEVLKLLQKSYHKRVKMIYIDPPYNTGNDFVYPDDFRDSIGNYLMLTEQTDEEGRKRSTNPETSGRYHTDWLNMMYPRLKLARNLLRDDGVLFVSIGDEEIHNLRKLCDELFGEENFCGVFVWEKKKKPSFLDSNMGTVIDYIVSYAKHRPQSPPFAAGAVEDGKKYPFNNAGNGVTTLTFPPKSVVFKCGDQHIPAQDMSEGNIKTELLDDVEIVQGMNANEFRLKGEWRYSQKTLDEFVTAKAEIIISKVPFRPNYVNRSGELKKTANLLSYRVNGVPTNEDATEEIRDLFGADVMSYPKPSGLLQYLTRAVTHVGDIVMDFFAGSGTLAHGVLRQNLEDGLQRRFVLVQLPEPLDPAKAECKAAYEFCKSHELRPNIAEIGKERIRRVGKSIIDEQEETRKESTGLLLGADDSIIETDLGFKVFRFDASNIKPWDADFDNVKEALLNAVENIKPNRTEADVLYELLLKYGLDLAVPIEQRKIDGKTVYIIGAGALIVCLADKVSLDVVEGIAKLKAELKPEVMRVVFKDAGFKDDVVKTNAVQILRQAGIEDVKSL